MQTRETYIQAVRAAVIATAPDLSDTERAMLAGLKMVYGSGSGTGARGVTYYGAWQHAASGCGQDCQHGSEHALIELCAFGEESVTQLCGTTVHELAHALAGQGTGHSADWKRACERLGLRRAKAAGTVYRAAMFAPALRLALVAIPLPADGKALAAWGAPAIGGSVTGPRGGCSHGRGSRGGRSRGAGSGSRLRKYTCDCGVIVRVARDDFAAHCDLCGSSFTREERPETAGGEGGQ